MKFTLSWLKEYLETDASVAEIGDKLTAIGLEVEAIEGPGRRARALSRRPRGQRGEAPGRRPAESLHRRHRRGTGAGGLRRAQRAHRHEGRLRARRQLHPPAPT